MDARCKRRDSDIYTVERMVVSHNERRWTQTHPRLEVEMYISMRSWTKSMIKVVFDIHSIIGLQSSYPDKEAQWRMPRTNWKHSRGVCEEQYNHLGVNYTDTCKAGRCKGRKRTLNVWGWWCEEFRRSRTTTEDPDLFNLSISSISPSSFLHGAHNFFHFIETVTLSSLFYRGSAAS